MKQYTLQERIDLGLASSARVSNCTVKGPDGVSIGLVRDANLVFEHCTVDQQLDSLEMTERGVGYPTFIRIQASIPVELTPYGEAFLRGLAENMEPPQESEEPQSPETSGAE